ADKINLNGSAIARLDVEAKTEHRIAGMRRSDTLGWYKADRGSLARSARRSRSLRGKQRQEFLDGRIDGIGACRDAVR
ncbi:MAG: hypothetical protein U5N27_16155, partial [Rhizobium sp.]|nr:hypothetical protein [Rhizobium sp.]